MSTQTTIQGPVLPPAVPEYRKAAAWAEPLLTLPFDSLRWAYALGVQSGAIARSLRASGRFEQGLAAVERLALGPWARKV